MKNMTDLMNDLTKTMQQIQEEMGYIEMSGQWKETVHDFTLCTANLRALHMIHEVWIERLQAT